MGMAEKSIYEIIATSSIFDGLTVAQLQRLSDFAVRKTFPKPVCLVDLGQTWKSLYFIEKGFVSTSFNMSDGREVGGFPLREGNWVHLPGVLLPNEAALEVWTGKSTRLISIPGTIVRTIAEENPVLYKNALSYQNRVFRLAHFLIWNTATCDGPQKVGRQLQLISSMTDSRYRECLPLSQEAIAKSLGMSRQTFSRHIKKLAALGVISIGYGKIDIVDYDRLKAFWGTTG